MAVKSSQLNITDLDFENISDNLKNYLKGQDQFKDYNFEGSSMSVLIDLLAYASHIGAVNTNIAASELFLDSAQIRKNVVSRAKDLGFVPSSETSSSAFINLEMKNVRNADGTAPTTTDMQLPRGTNFITVYDGSSYNFVVTTTKRPTQNGTSYNYNDIELVQGVYASDSFIFDSQLANPKFVLSNERVDKGRMIVSVTSNGVTETYALSTGISNITTESKVYYAQENEEGYVEIYFGDGTLGKSLLDGDIIDVTYIIVNDTHANGATQYTLNGTINGFTNHTVTNVTPASGGSEKESIESIKFKATKFYTSQNRLVTLNDYKAKVQEYYPNADAVAVWGGEDNDPPEYGKVFVALKPQNSDYLSDTEKTLVTKKLNDLNMLTVRPKIIDAEIVKILISCVFKYNENNTDLSIGELEAVVTSAIQKFDTDNLKNFDSIFRHSNLLKSVDDSNTAILSNTCNIRLRKRGQVKVGETKGYSVTFGNALYNPHSGHNMDSGGITTSTGFYIQGDSVNINYFDDDGKGSLRRYYLSGSTRIYQDSSAGTVDYSTGKITINAINITSTVNTDSSIDFTVIPSGNDVVATRGNLVDISSEDIKVTAEVDTISSGESSAGVGYTSTSTSSY
jgi:hypothetical protein|tara:strand:+ start:686 stop:2557 length:1872 start_codon:yes stop_codon:yes gene_type:complete